MNNCERIKLQAGDWIKLSDIPNEQVFNLVKRCFINAGFNDCNGTYAQWGNRGSYTSLSVGTAISSTKYMQFNGGTRQLSLPDIFNSVNGRFDWHGCNYIHLFDDGSVIYNHAENLYVDYPTYAVKRISEWLQASISPKTSQWWDYENGCAVGLPPVDTWCQYSLSDGRTWYKCKVISHDKLVLDCPHIETENDNGLQIVNKNAVMFRPLDYKSPKQILLGKALDLAAQNMSFEVFIERLYEADLLRNPE